MSINFYKFAEALGFKPISESTIISATLFAKVTDSSSNAYDGHKTLIKISSLCSMIFLDSPLSFFLHMHAYTRAKSLWVNITLDLATPL